MKTRSILSLLLALLMVLSLFPAAASAEGDAEEAAEELVPSDGTEALPPPADEPEADFYYIVPGNFPDPNFRDYISGYLDENHNGRLDAEEIAAAKEINCSDMEIGSLKGIEFFTALETLDCFNNQLTELDVSRNTALIYLDCEDNRIASLDLSKNVNLESLLAGGNRLTSLDLSHNPLIEGILCDRNKLTELNLSNQTLLYDLDCGGNRLSALNLRNHLSLHYLRCGDNSMTWLDVRGCSALKELKCENNSISRLNVTENPNLEKLFCEYNELVDLDLSGNPELLQLSCSGNDLGALDLSLHTKLQALWCWETGIGELDVSMCPELETFYCGDNSLTELDVTHNPALSHLDCSFNSLKTLDLSQNAGLVMLHCEGNALRRLELSHMSLLNDLHCYGNQIWRLDLASNPRLLEYLQKPAPTADGFGEDVLLFAYNPYIYEEDYYFLAVDRDTMLITDGFDRVRIYGKSRYDTSLLIAHAFIEELGADELDAVVVADGRNFADALAGSYLAIAKNAPILIVDPNHMDKAKEFIAENVRVGGTVYILGGTAAVPQSMEQWIGEVRVKRLAGRNRYLTNLEILKEAGIRDGDPILVCSGTGFADSLSASASGDPILLVGKTLTEEQHDFLSSLSGHHDFIIIGGEGAVSKEVENSCRSYCGPLESVTRIGGANRYETSRLVADRFAPDATQTLLAYGQNFPDGLCGAPLAHARRAPLLLVTDARYAEARAFARSHAVTHVEALGGPALISNNTIVESMGFDG